MLQIQSMTSEEQRKQWGQREGDERCGRIKKGETSVRNKQATILTDILLASGRGFDIEMWRVAASLLPAVIEMAMMTTITVKVIRTMNLRINERGRPHLLIEYAHSRMTPLDKGAKCDDDGVGDGPKNEERKGEPKPLNMARRDGSHIPSKYHH